MSPGVCPVCGSPETIEFIRRAHIPVVQNMIFSRKDTAVSVPRGDLQLACCNSCGFVFNSAFREDLVMYGNAYDNRQHFSRHFQEYIKKVSDCLTGKKGITHSHIIEVGCGDGTFLRLLVSDARYGNSGTGFDPSYRGPESDCNGRAKFIVDNFDERYGNYRGDVVVTRHVIEHIADPVTFLKTIRKTLDGEKAATVVIETPDVHWILKNYSFWDFCYEHCSYFSRESLICALKAGGFELVETTMTFGGQYMISLARPATPKDNEKNEGCIEKKLVPVVQDYAQHERFFIEKNRFALEKLCRRRSVFLWGAGAKGVMYANTLDPETEFISGIIDVNPDKQGGYIPGTGHPVISPESLPDDASVIIMNENYFTEIDNLVRAQRKKVQFSSAQKIAERDKPI